ncbi:Nif3-like dinuclear metal center hexameric protein [Rothia sp. LK2588]|uniref:Nif3-like dinuclear metal center hexameric protein n=1 Tax=Rothia sp. LK2588 TaxID=3114369 RepID=UPI0034CE8B3C
MTQHHPTLNDVVDTFHSLYPPHLAESWDASGLIAGRGERTVQKILFAVDAVSATAEEAVREEAQLLITHHPLLLKGANFIPAQEYKGAVLHTLIENKVGLLAAHTNADSAVDGVNEAIADLLRLRDVQILADEQIQERDGSQHTVGLGRVGRLEQPLSLRELAQSLAEILPATTGGLRIAGDPEMKVERVALCGGAGDSLFDELRASDADVYVTADLRHHPASELRERALVEGTGRPALIDCSHFASEWLWLNRGAQTLQQALAERGFQVECEVSTLNTDPWDFHVSTGSVSGSVSTTGLV